MLKRLKSLRRPLTLAGIATAMALFTCRPAMADEPGASQVRNKAVVLKSFADWSSGTGGPFDLLADDARWTIEGNSVVSKTYSTKEMFMREVIRPFNARMTVPLRPVVRSILAEGNTVVVFFDARATARDGQAYTNTYAWFLDMREGRIVKASAFFDAIEFNDLWSRVKPSH